MTCEELRGEYELHALGVLEDPERAELEDHLRRGCGSCADGIRWAFVTNAIILTLAPDIQAPRSLRERVIASTGLKSRNWLWIAVAASLLLALIWQGRHIGETQMAISFVNEPQTRQMAFPGGRIFLNAARGVLLLAGSLPQPGAGKTYELWVIPKGAEPKPAGLFAPDSRGDVMYLYKAPLDLAQTGAVAITIEPKSGSQAPTTTPIVVVPVGD